VETLRSPHAWIRTTIIWACVCLGIVFLYLVYMANNLDTILSDVDALDYAQISRNLAEGQGFTTDFIKPLSLTRTARLDDHPDLIFSPLHPLVTAGFMKALGANKRAVALACGAPFLLTLLVTYFLGLRLFDKRVALLGVALFGLYLGTLRYSISGLEVCLLGLGVTGLLLVLHLIGQEDRRVPWLAAGAGVLLGLIYLTKDVWAVLLIPALVYVFVSVDRRRRWLAVGLMLAAFAVVILPWCLRVAQLTGSPFFSWRWYEIEMETMTNPGNTLYRTFRFDIQSPLTFIIYHPLEMYNKLHDGAMALYGVLATLSGPFALGFFVVAILVPLGSPSFERLRYLVYATFILLFTALCWIKPSARMVYPLGPIIGLIAAALFFRVLTPLVKRYAPRERARAQGWAIALFVLLQVTPLLGNLSNRERPEIRAQMELEGLCRQVANLTSGVIISDVPWWTSWYSGRTSIWLPRSGDDLARMQQDVGQVQYLLLTPTVAQWQGIERTEEWVKVWSAAQSGRPVAYRGFAVDRVLDNNWVLFRKLPTLPSGPGGGVSVPGAG